MNSRGERLEDEVVYKYTNIVSAQSMIRSRMVMYYSHVLRHPSSIMSACVFDAGYTPTTPFYNYIHTEPRTGMLGGQQPRPWLTEAEECAYLVYYYWFI